VSTPNVYGFAIKKLEPIIKHAINPEKDHYFKEEIERFFKEWDGAPHINR